MIIQIKVIKGGVGKSFITANLGHLLSMLDKKVLIISTDAQNNVYSFFKTDELKRYKLVNLRNNLDFVPMKILGQLSKPKVENFLNKMNEIYDFILIDSVPTPSVDNMFLKKADKLIIPAFADQLTYKGIVKLIKDNSEKVHAIVFNKFNSNRNLDRHYYNGIKEICNDTNIIVTNPIRETTYINKFLLENAKTIFESKSTKINDIKLVFQDLVTSLF